MSELRDSFIKLFGKTIAFSSDKVSGHNLCSDSDSDVKEQEQDNYSVEQKQNKEPSEDEQQDSNTSNLITEPATKDPKTPSSVKISESGGGEECEFETETQQNSTEEKSLNKPDKILPCPRCNSKDTKFCYYNNYNVNQPRHFCKNCQRYWTAGGTMRNVPVGAGRRKSKNSTTLGINGRNFLNFTEKSQHCAHNTYWGCDFSGSWNMNCVIPSSRVLGKRSREGEVLNLGSEEVSNSGRCVWIPKSLRVEDPSEAAMRSIWSTLGIGSEKSSSMTGGGLYKSLKSIGNVKSQMGAPEALCANPAALSRSLNFRESA